MELHKFLVRAKLNTYASEGEGAERNLADGSKELTYQEDNYSYRDRYFGFNPFIGQEIVWRAGKAIWAMNYIGWVSDESIPPADLYHFLQKALRRVTQDRPYRGPSHFQDGEFEYFDENQGGITLFKGTEKITHKAKEVYRLEYHGGQIK